MWNGGTLTTAGNLVFQGTADGRFVAYTADRGEKVWEATIGTGIIASPVTFELDGMQYVTVMCGWGGSFPLAGGDGMGTEPAAGKVLTFALNAKQPLPDIASRKRNVTPVGVTASPETLETGATLFAQWCAVCHGIGVAGGGATPDLRYSHPATFDKYRDIVLDGKYQAVGMPSFRKWLTSEDVDAIRAYVLTRRAALSDKK
jgi:quinohemoprotein ethanol dehydrogenase